LTLKIRRWLLPVFIAVLATFALLTPVLAIADPDTMTIHGVWVYQNCRQDGDQLYIVDATLAYGANPSETSTEAFLCRLMNGSTELRAVAPYAYYDDGYDRFVVAIYFSSADAPAWEGSYTMELTGNPLLSWTGDPPSASVSAFNLWQDNEMDITQTVVSSRILYLADILELAWSVDMIEASGGGHYLTSYGEDYFTNVVEYASEVAPYAFSGQIIQPEIEDVDTSTAYADDLETDIVGTSLDLTDTATAFGVGRGPLTALLYYGAVVIFLAVVSQKLQTYKPAMVLSLPLVVLGAFVGVPLIVSILVGFVCILFIAWTLFYKPSSA